MFTTVRTSLPVGIFKVKRCDKEKLRTFQVFHLPVLNHRDVWSLSMGQWLHKVLHPELLEQWRRPTHPQSITAQHNTQHNRGIHDDFGPDDTSLVSKQEQVKWQFRQKLLHPWSQARPPEGPSFLFQAYAKLLQLGFCRWIQKRGWIPLYFWGYCRGKHGGR